MKFTKLIAKNWTCHSSLDLSFRAGIVGCLGANGSGKSSVLDALRFGLTGESIAEGKISDNLKFGEKRGHVEVQFEHNGGVYTIKRSVHTGGQSLIMPDGKTNMTRAADINQFIEELLGTKIDSLLNNIFVGQNDIDSILFKTAGDRLREFQETFGLTRLSDAHRYLTQEMALYKLTNGLDVQFDIAVKDRDARALELTAAGIKLTAVDKQIKALDVYVERIRAYEQAQKTVAAITAAQLALNKAKAAHVQSQKDTAECKQDHARLSLVSANVDPMRASINDNWSKCLSARLAEVKTASLRAELGVADVALHAIVEPVTGAMDAAKSQLTALKFEQSRDTAALNGKTYNTGADYLEIKEKLVRCVAVKQQVARREVSDREHELAQLVQHLRKVQATFVGGICPTCSQSVVGHDPKHITDELLAASTELANLTRVSTEAWDETNKLVNEKIEQLTQALVDVDAANSGELRSTIRTRAAVIEELARTTPEMERVSAAHTKAKQLVENLTSQLAQLRSMLVDPQEFDKAKSQFELLAQMDADCKRAETTLTIKQAAEAQALTGLNMASEARANLSSVACASEAEIAEAHAQMALVAECSDKRQSLLTLIGTSQACVEQYDSQIKQLQLQLKQEQQTRNWVDRCSIVRDAFHVNALPKMLMQEYALRLNRRMAHYLQVWESPFQVYLDENLAFIAKFPNGVTVSAGRLSGGQKIVASLSFRMAMSDTFAKNVGLIVLDEPTNHLDKSNITHLQQLLVKLKSLAGTAGKQIILVTHEETLTGFLDHIIRL